MGCCAPVNNKKIRNEQTNGSNPAKRRVDSQQELREYLQPYINFHDDFLTHHLKYQLSLTKLTSMKRIRRRQIMEHLWLQTLWGNIGGLNDLKINVQTYQESLISAWIQRTFLDIWQQAHQDWYIKKGQDKEIKRKIAQQFMFELYQFKQYIDSGMTTLNFMLDDTRTALSIYIQASDDSLYNMFKLLKQKYLPVKVKRVSGIENVKDFQTDPQVLNHFPQIFFSDPDNMNYQTIFDGVAFLLDRAIEEESTFISDMQKLLGGGTQAEVKVQRVVKDGKKNYNATAVGRIFVKWAQSLLYKFPELKTTKTFMRLIKAKSQIVNNFFFKSTVRPTSHKAVIDCLCQLIELAKYDLKTKKRRPDFSFDIYDLLRCRIKKSNPQELIELLRKLEATKVTDSGKSFMVCRVKNRLDTHKQDLIVNFRYGNVIVGQAQLKIALTNNGILEEQKLTNSIHHYIIELQRSIFGPTIELLTRYQIFERTQSLIVLEAEGQIKPRRNEIIESAVITQRKCLQGHEMVTLRGNYFIKGQPDQNSQEVIEANFLTLCNYCDRKSTLQKQYDYCFQCGCYLCKDCRQDYQKDQPSNFIVSIQRGELFKEFTKFQEIKVLCQKYKSLVVIFWLEGSSSSTLLKDAITLHQAKRNMQDKKSVPKIVHIRYSDSQEYKNLAQKLQIREYPTMILFDKDAKPYKTVLGFSWFEIPKLCAIQVMLAESRGISSVGIYCGSCQERMESGQLRKDGQCMTCFNTSKNTYVPSQIHDIGAYCSNGHYRCMNCCYAVLDCPSVYKDYSGSNYLSSNFTISDSKLPRCPNNHLTKLKKDNPTQSWEYKCWKCKQKRLFDNQHGVGICLEGQSFLCPKCMQAKLPSFQETQNQMQLVSHFVESSAETIPNCVCSRPFKKVYTTRLLSQQELKSSSQRQWACRICKQKKRNDELHLACFNCPSFQQSRKNIQICLKCARNSLIFPKIKAKQTQSILRCPKDKQKLMKTMNQNLKFNCYYCHKNYFGNTERLNCKTCKLNCCYDCRYNLWQLSPPICNKKSPKGQKLSFRPLRPRGIDICDICQRRVEDEVFICQEENYVICPRCAQPQFQTLVERHVPHVQSATQEQRPSNIYQVFKGYKRRSQREQDNRSISSWNDEYCDFYEFNEDQ